MIILQQQSGNKLEAIKTKRREKKLLDRVRDAVRTKHHPIRTEEAYVNWIKRFILLPKSLWNKRKGAETKAGGIGPKNNKSQPTPDLRRKLALNVSCSLISHTNYRLR